MSQLTSFQCGTVMQWIFHLRTWILAIAGPLDTMHVSLDPTSKTPLAAHPSTVKMGLDATSQPRFGPFSWVPGATKPF